MRQTAASSSKIMITEEETTHTPNPEDRSLHSHLQFPVAGVDEKHVFHNLNRSFREIELLGFREFSTTGIYDESNRNRGCNHPYVM